MTREIQFEMNTCAGCGKEYNQPAVVTPFGVFLSHYCPECVDKYDRKHQAIENQIKDKKKKDWLAKRYFKEKICFLLTHDYPLDEKMDIISDEYDYIINNA
jgi:hypothetical protein